MKQLVLTLLGKDKPGLVEQLASLINRYHGHWLKSNLSQLCGLFAGIIQIEVPENHLFELKQALNDVADLDIKMQDIVEHEINEQQEHLNLVITGNDRSGIVQDLSSIIRHKGANILHLTTSQQGAPNWGSTIFNVVAEVELPPGLVSDDVVEALEAFANDLMVDVEPA